jgi:hypothetical protein
MPYSSIHPEVPVDSPPPSPQLGRHVSQRAIIVPELRLLFVPVPKASCTSVMWSIAGLVGLDQETFSSSEVAQVTPTMTIHDMSKWPDQYRLSEAAPEAVEAILAADDWFRFTVVRDPFRRIWSAWQSKVLLAEPQFIEGFGDQAWFATPVDTPDDVRLGFRAFVEAMATTPDLIHANPHWEPQVELIGHPEFPFDHVGRVERLDETLEALRAHIDQFEVTLPEPRFDNTTPLPYADELFTERDAETLSKAYELDLEAFGYSAPEGPALADECDDDWREQVDRQLPVVREVRIRHARLFELDAAYKASQADLRNDLRQERGRARRLQNRVDTVVARLEQKNEKLAEREAKLREKNQTLSLLRKDRKALRQLRAQDARKLARLEKAQAQLQSTRAELQSLRASSSWRLTAPIRKVAGGLRRVRSGFRRRGRAVVPVAALPKKAGVAKRAGSKSNPVNGSR